MTYAIWSQLKPAVSKPGLKRLNLGWFIALLPLALTLYCGAWWLRRRREVLPRDVTARPRG